MTSSNVTLPPSPSPNPRPRILAICGDPGGASAVGPVIRQLREENRLYVEALAYNEAAAVWEHLGVSHQVLQTNLPPHQIPALLKQSTAQLLLTGTSVNPVDYEKQFIAAARQLSIPSLAVLDFWLNYTWRFSDAEGNLIYLPDKIAIMDELARLEMIQEGFDPARLVITGQPAFDDLAHWRERFSPQIRQDVRREIGIHPDEKFILFPSQPQSSLYGEAKENHLGFDEWVVLDALIHALEKIERQYEPHIHLVIRPHPREDPQSFLHLQSEIIPITVSTAGGARNQVMSADMVVGMNTELLVEACYLGCITLSLQPGLRHADRLPTNRVGVSRAVYRHREIKPAIEDVLLNEKTRQHMRAKLKTFKLEGNATQNVVELIQRMLSLS